MIVADDVALDDRGAVAAGDAAAVVALDGIGVDLVVADRGSGVLAEDPAAAIVRDVTVDGVVTDDGCAEERADAAPVS
jgi:hypothetical protein